MVNDMSLKVAESFSEVVELGRTIAKSKKHVYTEKTLDNMMESVNFHCPDLDDEKKQQLLYAAIYDWNAYGANVNEEFA